MTIEKTVPAVERAEAAIHKVVADAVAQQGDVDGFMALHTEEVVLVNLAGRRVIGKPALREAMSAAMATPMAGVLTESEIIEITHLMPGVAVVSCLKRITDTNVQGSRQLEGIPTTASLTYLMTEDDQGWRIALAQTTPIR